MASLMALLNGGVLGLMHRSLMLDVRPSAVDWRIGTLLFAGGGILMAAHMAMPEALLAPLVDTMMFVGATLYWRSIRRFGGQPDTFWIFVPAALGVCVVLASAAAGVGHAYRGALASAVLVFVLSAVAYTLLRSTRADIVHSRRVAIALLHAVAVLVSMRAVIFVGMLASPRWSRWSSWADVAATVAISALPVIGTTAFLLMCSERARHALQRAADTDELTGLPNRRAITRAGETRFLAARQGTGDFAIATIDVDFFKRINDRYGHAIGDAALRHVAERLATACSAPHLLGRQGGEEFVAFLEADDETSAIALAEGLRRAVNAEPFAVDGAALTISASVGVSMRIEGDLDFDDVLRRADAALYAAKAGGRNRVEVGRAEVGPA